MANAFNTYTLLSLDQWADIMGVSRWELNQVSDGLPGNAGSQCKTPFFQYRWQKDYLAREELGDAIAEAERMIAAELRYWPAPLYTTNEEQQYPRDFRPYWWGEPFNPRGDWKPLELNWQHYLTPGILARTEISPTVAPVYSDEDGDGLQETFTITVATAVTNAAEIGIYFTAADRMGNPIDEVWRIRPVRVSFSGGNAVIVGHKAMLIKPSLLQEYAPSNLNATNAANYVAGVAVYRVYTDSTHTEVNPNQGSAVWFRYPDCTSFDCEQATTPLCLRGNDNERGVVAAQFEDPTLCCSGQSPDKLLVNYLSGIPLVDGKVRDEYAKVIAYLAVTLISSAKCGCMNSSKIIEHWRAYPNRTASNDQVGGLTVREIEMNPFGEPRLGALYAWRRVSRWKIGDVVSL